MDADYNEESYFDYDATSGIEQITDDFDVDMHAKNLEQKASRSLARLNERRLDMQRKPLGWRKGKYNSKNYSENSDIAGLSEAPKGGSRTVGPVEKGKPFVPDYAVHVSSEGNVYEMGLSSPVVEHITPARKRLYL